MADFWQIHCDGTAIANRMSIGVVLVDPDGVKHALSRAYERPGCSNEAEALALIAALEEAERLGARTLRIYCDNSVVIAQTIGSDRTRIERLARVFGEARTWLARFDDVQIQWVPRHKNTEADALARHALGLPAKPPKINQKKLKPAARNKRTTTSIGNP